MIIAISRFEQLLKFLKIKNPLNTAFKILIAGLVSIRYREESNF
jgi:hypothetical protein